MQQRTVRVAGVVGIAAALVVGGVALGLAASNQAATAAASPACASSYTEADGAGDGNASATPDLLTVAVDIDVTDPSAQASLVDDNSKADAVIAALKQGGVHEQGHPDVECLDPAATTTSPGRSRAIR